MSGFEQETNILVPGSEVSPTSREVPTVPMDDAHYLPDDQAIPDRGVAIRRAAAIYRRAAFEVWNLEKLVGEDKQEAESNQKLLDNAKSEVKDLFGQNQ